MRATLLQDPTRKRALFCAFAALVALRAPWLVVAPRFFAEEGILYFRYALGHDALDALLAPHLGYYALVPNAATLLASRLPLVVAPYATLLAAFAVQLVPAALVLHDEALWPRARDKALALLVLLLPLAMRREWLSTVHAQFWLALSVTLMLVVPPRTRAARAGYALVTLVAAFTGGVSDALAPLFLLAFLVRRDKRLLLTFAVLATGALVQASLLAGVRELRWTPHELLAVALGKLVVVPLSGPLGAPLTEMLFAGASSLRGAFVIGVASLGAFALAARALEGEARTLFVAATYLGLASLFAALGTHEALAEPLVGIRYVFVPHVAYGLLLVHARARAPEGMKRSALGAALTWMLVVGGMGAAFAGASWRAGFAYRADARARARDAGRTLTMHDVGCKLAVRPNETRQGFDVRVSAAPDDGLRVRIHPAHADRKVRVRAFVVHIPSPSSPSLLALHAGRFEAVRYGVIGDAQLTEPGFCFTGDDVPSAASGRGTSIELSLPRAALDTLPPDASVFVGYGRDMPDALAKGTFVEIPVRP